MSLSMSRAGAMAVLLGMASGASLRASSASESWRSKMERMMTEGRSRGEKEMAEYHKNHRSHRSHHKSRAELNDRSRAELNALAGEDIHWEAKPMSLLEIKARTEKANTTEQKMCSANQRLCAGDTLALYQLGHTVGAILDRHQVMWWATGGTLLGAVRNKGIIPHDDDIDYNILGEQADFLDAPAFKADMKKNGLEVHNVHQDFWKVYPVNKTGHRVNGPNGAKMGVDLFALIRDETGEPDERLHYPNGWWSNDTYPRSLCDEVQGKKTTDGEVVEKCPSLVKWPFGSGTVWAPERKISEAFLSAVYNGDDWRKNARCEFTNHPCGLTRNATFDVSGHAEPGGPLKEPL